MQLNEMNGKMISGKPLYVAFAQRKEERKAMLQVIILKLATLYIVLMLKLYRQYQLHIGTKHNTYTPTHIKERSGK